MTRYKDKATEVFLHGLLLILALVVLLPGVFLRGEMSLPGGILLQSPPWNQYEQGPPPDNWLPQETLLQGALWYRMATESIEDGEWPLWNPLQLAGMPLLANFQSSVFYPPRLIHLLFDPYVATTVFTLSKLWLCGFTAFLLGRGIGLSRAPAQFLSLGWMLCAYNQYWAYWPPPDVSAWAPLCLLGVEWILAARYRRGFFTLALGATMLLLAGHPETAFGFGLGMGAYFVLRAIFERRRYRALWHPFATAGAAWCLAVLVCAAAILPLMEYLPVSEQFVSRPGEEVAVHYAPAEAYISLWLPRYFGSVSDGNYWGSRPQNFVNTLYVGVAAWVGIGLLLTRRPVRLNRIRLACLAFAVVFCTAMAFPLPFMRWIQELPVLDSMWRFYYLPFALLGFLLLAAWGIEEWFAREHNPKDLFWPCVALSPALLVALATYATQYADLMTRSVFIYVSIQIVAMLGLAVLSLMTLFLATKYIRWRRVAPYVLVAILAVDLLYAARDLRPTCPREQLFFDTALTDYLRELPQPSRVRVGPAGIMPGLLQHYGIEQWNGYDGIMPYRSRAFFTNTYKAGAWQRVHRIASIDHYLFRSDIESHPELYPKLERVGIIDNVLVMRDPTALPRAFLVGGLRTVESEDALFKTLVDPKFDPLREVVTEMPPPPPWPEGRSDSLGTAIVTRHGANSVCVEVEAQDSCVLVLADTYFPGWTAHVDGEPSTIFPAYFAFRGVLLSEGQHHVVFKYEPRSFTIGLAVSTITLLAGAIAALAVLVRSRRSTVPAKGC